MLSRIDGDMAPGWLALGLAFLWLRHQRRPSLVPARRALTQMPPPNTPARHDLDRDRQEFQACLTHLRQARTAPSAPALSE